jgi:hypothetical protein
MWQLALIASAGLLVVMVALPVTWNAAALLVFVSSGMATLVAAVLLQIASPVGWGTIYRTNPRYLFELIPNSKKYYQHQAINGGRRILVQVNSHGFRGAELREPKIGIRVVVYGDSFIEGEFSDRADTFAERLGCLLEQSMAVPVEAVNAGVVSYGPDQISVRLESEIEELEPDLVVVAVYAGNDFGDLLRDKMFALDADSGLVKRHFVLSDAVVRNVRRAGGRLALVNLIDRTLYGSSGRGGPQSPANPYRVVEDALRATRLEYRDYVLDHDSVVTNLMLDHYDADISLEPTSASARYKVRLMGGVLTRIGALASQHRIPLLFLIIPSPIDVADGYDVGQVDTTLHPGYRRSTLTDALERALADAGLHYVNLFQPFRQQDANGLYFHGVNNHWNARGQDLAARLVAFYVLKNRLLAK